MDENKKDLIVGYVVLGCIALYSFGVGYFYGNSKPPVVKLFSFTTPLDFNSDDVQFCHDEIMQELKKYNYNVTNDKYREIVNRTLVKAIKTKSMTDELFHLGDN